MKIIKYAGKRELYILSEKQNRNLKLKYDNPMLKNCAYYFCFFIICVKLISQIGYDKLIQPGKKWYVSYKYAFAGGNCQPVYEGGNLFSFSNDTLVNNKKYYKLKPGHLLVREDTIQKKIYGLLPWFNPYEKLIFDFNANSGDTIFNLFCYGKYYSTIEHLLAINAYPVLYGECNINLRNFCTGNNYLVVQNIDSVFFCNKKRKRITFNNSSIEWIEGVGYKSGFLECASLFKLKCFYENSCSYDFINQSENTYSCGIVTEMKNTPKPEKNQLKIRWEENFINIESEEEAINNVTVRDILGRTLIDFNNLNQHKILIHIPHDNIKLIIITIKFSNSKTEYIKFLR